MSFNLATMLRESRHAAPERTCLYIGDRRISYRELDDSSDACARGLRAAGLHSGDTLAVALPNLAEFVVAYFGALKAGAVLCAFNPLLTARELTYCLRDANAHHLIAFAPTADAAFAAAGEIGDLTVYAVAAADSPVRDAARPISDLLSVPPGDGPGPIAPTSADDTAVLLYTSGTTGRPKGAELSHFQMYMNATLGGQQFGVREDDVSLCALPLFHVYGLSSVLNTAVRYGGGTSLLPRFTGQAALDQMAAHGVSVMVGVPTMYGALLTADRSGRDLGRLRIGSVGGDSMPAELLRRCEETFSITILEGYGLSETCSTATVNPGADRRLRSVGKPLWGVEVRIAGADEEPLPRGAAHVGEIWLRGHNVISRYRHQPEASAAALRDGWLRTGDLGYVDDDGFVFIVDRKKDLVIRGGYNVYPREVEEVLYGHPAIEEAAVIGRHDDRLGEEVVAIVSAAPGMEVDPDEVVAYCRQRLAAYKYPRMVRVLPDLPKGPSGKVLKKELRDMV